MNFIHSTINFIFSPWEEPLERDKGNNIKFNFDNFNQVIKRIERLVIALGLIAGAFCLVVLPIEVIKGTVAPPVAALLAVIILITGLMMGLAIQLKAKKPV